MYIYTAAEADYRAAHNDYENAREGFYAGTVSAQDFIALRNAMEDALTAWEADSAAA
jgi:multidrug resistance efflux pump